MFIDQVGWRERSVRPTVRVTTQAGTRHALNSPPSLVQVRIGSNGIVGVTLRADQVLPLRKNAAGRAIAWEDGELAVGMYNATFSDK